MKKKIIIIVSIIVVILVIIAGLFWYFMGEPLYKPGMVKRGENLRSSLEPPAQTNDSSFWLVEKDIKLFHFSDGVGKKVLVIHGGPGYPYEKPIEGLKQLTDRYQFIYYDQRGCGRLTKPIDKFSSSNFYDNMKTLDKALGLGAQIADIERIRRILGEEKLTIIGHSFGGFLASMYAAEFPERVNSLILISPASVLVMPIEGGGLYEEVKNLLPENMKNEYSKYMERYFDYSNIFSKSEADLISLNAEFGKYYAVAAKAKNFTLTQEFLPERIGGWMVHGAFFSMGKRHDYRDALKNITAPVLVIHGEKDLQSENASKIYSEYLPNCKFKVIKDAGHFSFNDKPEEFVNVVGEFLTEHK